MRRLHHVRRNAASKRYCCAGVTVCRFWLPGWIDYGAISMSKPDWKNAPEDATHYEILSGLFCRGSAAIRFNGVYHEPTVFKFIDNKWDGTFIPCYVLEDSTLYEPRPQKQEPASKYHREIKPGVWVDVYDVLFAFDPDNRNSADDHAIKKMLLPGKRHQKDGVQDREEAIMALQRSVELIKNDT